MKLTEKEKDILNVLKTSSKGYKWNTISKKLGAEYNNRKDAVIHKRMFDRGGLIDRGLVRRVSGKTVSRSDQMEHYRTKSGVWKTRKARYGTGPSFKITKKGREVIKGK